jgi:hypothetical protein
MKPHNGPDFTRAVGHFRPRRWWIDIELDGNTADCLVGESKRIRRRLGDIGRHL